jgi:hypothetical protein
MDIFTVFIQKIHNVTEGKHVVLVDCDTDCYGVTKHNQVVFFKTKWNRIKNQMKYLETEGMDSASFRYYEEILSDVEFYERFEKSLSEFSDKEIIDEINRRVAKGSITVSTIIAVKAGESSE